MKKYPKTEKYDANWIEQNWMGPNPLWLLEDLCEHIDLRPGMKVLDMGCGKGITSIFLAKEYGVTVFANDLWISATDNLRRFEEADVADKVFPIHAEAHALPYAEGFFGAAIAIDCYHYFGASESYFPDVFSKLVKPDGQFGVVIPGLRREYEKGYPETGKIGGSACAASMTPEQRRERAMRGFQARQAREEAMTPRQREVLKEQRRERARLALQAREAKRKAAKIIPGEEA